ncbi:MAG: hypothetical protein J3R72DRAFT_74090 [Linnemannia gamsii]|nr:MAG: hypothetical protein J3R72DRAFT_74090 [Linnemannia gamsii]
MHPDETLLHTADPGQSSTGPACLQGQHSTQAPTPNITSTTTSKQQLQQQQQQPNDPTHAHTQAASTTIRRKQAPQPQNNRQVQQQEQQNAAQPLNPQPQQHELEQQQTDFQQQQQQQRRQQRRIQETEQEQRARRSGSSTGQSSTRQRSQSSQHSSTASTFDMPAATGLHHHLLSAAHYGQELQQRNAALEAENRQLNEIARQQRMSALEWCQMAKTYQRHRDLMTLRLEELEMDLVKMAQKKTDKTEARTEKSCAMVVASSSTSHQHTSMAQTTKDDEEDDIEKQHQFLSQSIANILDEMTPAEKEPSLLIFSKTGHGGQSLEVDGVPGRVSKPPSALKQPSKTTKCKCGCQEEIRAWKTRCKYAESQAMALELRCEQLTLNFDGQKKEWAQWKAHLIQQQYQRRMRAAMPFNTSQFMSPFESSSLQQQYPSQQASLPPSIYEGSFKRARFETEGSETSSQRQERTDRNTRYNQITTSFVPGGQSVMGAHADRRKSSSSIKRATGKGSAEEPHILIDRDDGSSSDGFAGPSTSLKRPRKETTILDTSEGNEAPAENDGLVLSPTFPSDMTLRLRQYQVNTDDDEDDSDGYTSPSNRSNLHGGPTAQKSVGTQKSHLRNPATPTRAQQAQIIVAPDSIPSDSHAPSSSHDYASDRSSPPMFDTADFITHKAPSRQVRRHNTVEGIPTSRTPVVVAPGPEVKTITSDKHHHQSKPSKVVVNHGGRRNSSSVEPFIVYEDPDPVSVVLETPLELQGVRGDIPSTTHIAVSEVIEIAEDDSVAAEPVDYGVHGGGGTDVDASIGADGDDYDDGGSDKENSPPEHPIVVERRGSDGMMDFEEAISVAPGRRDISPSKANVPEVERIYNFTERRKSKRKLMHGHNCECCRRFYELTGPLPLPDGYSHFFQPIPRPGEKEVWERTDEERLQDRIQEVSRHRVHHMPPLTPPGFWDTDFPSTPERKKWDEIDRERRDRKREQERHQAEQLLRKQQRRGGSSSGIGSSSRAGPSGASRSKF